MRKLIIDTPPEALVEAYLEEIAKGYGVPYTRPDHGDDGDGGGLKEVRYSLCPKKCSD
jgi:vacuolar protein sorting-associated protein IST1